MVDKNVAAPHIGAIVEKVLNEKNIRKTELASRMGQQPGTVNAIIRQRSLRMYRLWDICIAVNHDFFADLSELLPEGMEVSAHTRQAARIATLEQQVRDLQKEVEIYERITKKAL